jgi:phosphosulfolactate synthase (CoM biosynthesis protein A)
MVKITFWDFLFLSDLIAVFGMGLQQLIFQICDFTRFIENIGCDINFADVVQQSTVCKSEPIAYFTLRAL